MLTLDFHFHYGMGAFVIGLCQISSFLDIEHTGGENMDVLQSFPQMCCFPLEVVDLIEIFQ